MTKHVGGVIGLACLAWLMSGCEPESGKVPVSEGIRDTTGADDVPGSDPETDEGPTGPWCTPACEGRLCGMDGCGGICGECGTGKTCSNDGQCVTKCVPQCQDKTCGDNGCGGTCGTCPEPWVCRGGACCMPRCEQKECGDDGCGGTCGPCQAGQVCLSGLCCSPDCVDKQCGPDGCGGFCAMCPTSHQCFDGECRCVPFCLGRQCGPDGCGGTCGTCEEGLACTGGHCGCTPVCTGKKCGDDGCGGYCGFCVPSCQCEAGLCVGVMQPYVNGCDGTVLDPATGQHWKRESGPSMTWQVASDYCKGLQLGGYTDWRLPAVEELRALIIGCPATQVGGACPAGNSCTSAACLPPTCNGCTRNAGPGPGGRYLHEAFDSGADTHYWSSIRLPLSESPALIVEFDSARVSTSVTTVSLKAVRCVR